jgi:hypothetical protein
MDPVTGLAVGRIVVGTIAFLSPSLAARMFMLDPKANPQLSYMGRMFASREVALGALTLTSTGEARRRLVQVGMAVDGADALTALAAAARGKVSKKAGLIVTAAAIGAVAAGAQELQEA